MPKLVYVYEGVNADYERHELIGVKYFGGGYEGSEGTKNLWNEVYEYIEKSYDADSIETIYVNGDGADWIKAGAKVHAKSKFVLDKYHMHKYIIAATSHLMDSAPEVRSEIWRAINGKRKWKAEEIFNRIIEATGSESKKKDKQKDNEISNDSDTSDDSGEEAPPKPVEIYPPQDDDTNWLLQ